MSTQDRNPEVSIVMASYNKERYVAESIRSVLSQEGAAFELIVVDDCSTDSTRSVIAGFADARMRVIPLGENKGANHCRNLGIGQARGSYVMFLDADDLLAPGCLRSRLKAAAAHPAANLLVFTMGVFNTRIGDDARQWKPEQRHALDRFLSHDLPWAIVQPLWRRSFLKDVGGFDESFDRLQDVELHTRALMHPDLNLRVVGGDPDCYYRIDAQRKTHAGATFMERWVGAVTGYYRKFAALLPRGKRSRLLGTVYQVYTQLIYEFRQQRLTEAEFRRLEENLLSPVRDSAGSVRRILFQVSRTYNLRSLRVPGVNFLIKRLIVA